jgi:hypothetical protein
MTAGKGSPWMDRTVALVGAVVILIIGVFLGRQVAYSGGIGGIGVALDSMLLVASACERRQRVK